MDINENLASLILQVDESADWVYNHYCGYCGKFLYDKDLETQKCSKCNSPTEDKISRPIPFNTSGTACQKAVEWVIKMNNNTREYGKLIDDLKYLHNRWLDGQLVKINHMRTKYIARHIYNNENAHEISKA